MLELFIRQHWLAKKLLNNLALSLNLVIYLFDETVAGRRESFYCGEMTLKLTSMF